MAWDIEYYKTRSGQEVIKDFIDNLQESTQAKLGRQLELLEEHGIQLGMPHAKPMGGWANRAASTWEARSQGILRLCVW
jgi:hypothetical protein